MRDDLFDPLSRSSILRLACSLSLNINNGWTSTFHRSPVRVEPLPHFHTPPCIHEWLWSHAEKEEPLQTVLIPVFLHRHCNSSVVAEPKAISICRWLASVLQQYGASIWLKGKERTRSSQFTCRSAIRSRCFITTHEKAVDGFHLYLRPLHCAPIFISEMFG